jgi:hypothetical protein
MNPLEEIGMPLYFSEDLVAEALDNYDRADPHRRQDELDDKRTSPIVNAPLYDTSITTPIKKSELSLESFPDYSDEVLSDYKLAILLNKPVPAPDVADLDTDPDYVKFIKNSIKNIIQSESEFNLNRNRITTELIKQQKLAESTATL